ncbi:hypothetical protein AK830_g9627 [Neonectria ditissima]|uniref:Uncharacterized protein n=1 Tax=Neonectria ditissima TaxID=78410 RepID=A0A0N8H5S1_9HYPO|nr:hypothetical protein AK830_g9627 [Neonectria ditissima]
MEAQKEDYAFNSSLWAYSTEITNREQKKVIRFRKDTSGEPKPTLDPGEAVPKDMTRAGKEWSTQESTITDVYMGELAVVVGEFLPERALKIVPILGKPATLQEFDPKIHDTMPVFPRSLTVVRRLSDQKSNLHVLYDKDNLCRIFQLPTNLSARLVYYREWTGGKHDASAKQRQTNWRNNLSVFCKKYIEEHEDDFLDAHTSSTQKLKMPGQQWGYDIDTVEGTRQSIMKSLALYRITSDTQYLNQVIRIIDFVTKTDVGKRWMEDQEPHRVMENMIRGTESFTADDATEALSVCKVRHLWAIRVGPVALIFEQELWGPPPDDIAPVLNAGVILEVAQGLRAGVLDGVWIHESLFRAFVTCFAIKRSEGVPRNDAIEQAYRYTMVMVGQVKLPAPPPPVPARLLGPPSRHEKKLRNVVQFLRTMARIRRSQVNGLNGWIEVNRRRFSGRYETAVPVDKEDNLEAWFNQAASVTDFNMSKRNLLDLAHSIWVCLEAPMSQFVTTLTIEQAEVEAVTDALVGFFNRDEDSGADEEKGKDKDDDEGEEVD